MQTDLNRNTFQNPTQSLDNPGFDQMAQSLSGALAEFTEQSPAIFATITAALRPIGEYSLKAWSVSSNFVRRHPVQTAVGVVAIGFMASLLVKRAAAMAESEMPISSDGRQY